MMVDLQAENGRWFGLMREERYANKHNAVVLFDEVDGRELNQMERMLIPHNITYSPDDARFTRLQLVAFMPRL